MHLRDWLSQRWPDGDLPIDVVIAIGSGVARSLAEAWDRPDARVHGALCIEALRVDPDGCVAIVGAIQPGDRIAHQRDLQSAGRVLYGLVMDETPEETADPIADRVAAVLQSIRSSSLQRARGRIRAVHPVVGGVIARMLETSDEHGFTDGWAVAEAFDHLSVLPVSDVLAPGMPPLFPEEDDPSDSTMFVELYRSGDDLLRAEPVRTAVPPLPPRPPRAALPPLPRPAVPAPALAPPPAPPARRAALQRGLGSVVMCVASMWFIGLAMGCAALWHNRCQTSAAPVITPPSIPVIADIDEGDTGDFEVPEHDERPVVRGVQSDRRVKAPGPRKDRLSITLSDGAMAHSLELSCPGGYRKRVSVRAGAVVFTGVPVEACLLSFKGPIPARFQPVNGGKSLRCRVVGTTAVCT